MRSESQGEPISPKAVNHNSGGTNSRETAGEGVDEEKYVTRTPIKSTSAE